MQENGKLASPNVKPGMRFNRARAEYPDYFSKSVSRAQRTEAASPLAQIARDRKNRLT